MRKIVIFCLIMVMLFGMVSCKLEFPNSTENSDGDENAYVQKAIDVGIIASKYTVYFCPQAITSGSTMMQRTARQRSFVNVLFFIVFYSFLFFNE